MRRAHGIRPLLMALLLPVAASALTLPVYPAGKFVESVGVNTHLRHRGSVYDTHFDVIRERLLAANIRHVRDGAMDRDGQFFERDAAQRFAELGRAGIRITFIFRPMVPREFVQGWPARVESAFEAFEMPNELNQRKDLPWAEALRVWAPLFHEYVHGVPATSNYPIVGPSIADVGGNPHAQLGDLSRFLDYGNLHKYYRAFHPATSGYGNPGAPPCDAFRYGSLSYSLCQVRRVSADKPVWCTEAGYATEGDHARAVPPAIQARYLVRMLLLHFKAGIERTYLYQLADSGSDAGASMGLLDTQGREKPAYRAIAGLLRELVDDGDATGTSPAFEVEGDLQGVEGIALGKSDGSFRLVLWLEQSSFDTKSARVIDAAERPIEVALPPGWRSRRLLELDAEGRFEMERIEQRGRVRLELTDRPLILDVARESS